MTGNPRPIGVLLFLSFLFLPSCGADSGVTEDIGAIPDTVSENFRQVTVSAAGRVEVESRRVETFSTDDLTVFTDASMRELDAEGDLSLEGRASRIETTGNGNGSAEGGVFVRDIPGDFSLEAERLEWDEGERLLTGVGIVSIETGDGLSMAGEGFAADMARESYSFAEGAEGTLIIEERSVDDGEGVAE